jgi:hypothetical protein
MQSRHEVRPISITVPVARSNTHDRHRACCSTKEFNVTPLPGDALIQAKASVGTDQLENFATRTGPTPVPVCGEPITRSQKPLMRAS